MKTIILKNTTNNDITISSLGLTILKNENVNIDETELFRFSVNTELFSLINPGNIVVNNGTKDLTHDEARVFLQPVGENIFSNFSHTHTKNEISDFSHNHDDIYFTKDNIQENYSTKTWISSNFSLLNHNHNDLYHIKENVYTKNELQTLGSAQVHWGNLASVPATFTPSIHNHDDLYFTETEINTLLSGKANTVHTHDDRYFTETEINNSFYTKTELNNGQLNNLYYTKTNLQTSGSSQINWNNLTSVPTTFTPSVHTHDDRYYTQSILDTKFNLYYTKNEVNTITSNYYTKTESDNRYSIISHIHDDRYYTESEIDQMITASTFGISGAVDTFADLPATNDVGIIYIVRQTVGSNQEGFYKWNGSWQFLANNTGTSVHNQTLGLNDGDYKHLTQLEYSDLTDGGNTSLHKHDDFYYTEDEIDYKIQNIKTAGVKAVVDQYEDLLSITDEIPGTVYVVRERSGVQVGDPQLYSQTPNTIIHMKFDGNTNDVLGHTNVGSGTVTYETGKVGQCGVFNNSYRSYNNTADLNVTNTFSCGVWFYPTQLDPAKNYSLFDKYPTNGSQSGWGLIIEEGGRIQIWAMGPNQPFVRVRTYSKLRLNEWTHIGLSFDGTMIKLWKNAIVVAQLPFNGNIGANTAPLDIGRYYTDYLYGKLDDLFYTRDTLTYNDFMRIVNNGPFAEYHDEGFWMWDGTSWKFLIQNMSGIYHNELLGVNREEFLHLTKNEYSKLTQGLETTLHLHDGRYYTETESDAKYSIISHNHNDLYYTEAEIDALLSGYVLSTHTHDDRYYTETEINNSFYTKTNLQTSGSAQVHWGNLISVPTTFTPSVHNHNDLYYTKTESDAKYSITSHLHDDRYNTKSEITTLLSGKANTSHTHDDRYYTETESDAKYSIISHTHDDRYFTESEINTKLGQIDFAFVASNDSTTNITAAELETLTNGSNADGLHTHANSGGGGTLDAAYGAWGAGRIIDVDYGPVQLNASAGFAPLKLTPVNYTPNQWLGGGELVVKNNRLYLYDSTRSKFLSIDTINLQWSSNSNDAQGYVFYGNAQTNSNTGFVTPFDCTIVAITGAAQDSANTSINIEVNGSNQQTIWWQNGYINLDNLNINANSGDRINLKLSTSGGPDRPNKPCLSLFIKERL